MWTVNGQSRRKLAPKAAQENLRTMTPQQFKQTPDENSWRYIGRDVSQCIDFALNQSVHLAQCNRVSRLRFGSQLCRHFCNRNGIQFLCVYDVLLIKQLQVSTLLRIALAAEWSGTQFKTSRTSFRAHPSFSLVQRQVKEKDQILLCCKLKDR